MSIRRLDALWFSQRAQPAEIRMNGSTATTAANNKIDIDGMLCIHETNQVTIVFILGQLVANENSFDNCLPHRPSDRIKEAFFETRVAIEIQLSTRVDRQSLFHRHPHNVLNDTAFGHLTAGIFAVEAFAGTTRGARSIN